MSKEINIYKTQSTIDSTDQDLDLNTDIVHNKTNTYNSLSDLYGIQLFTDARMEETRIKNIENGKKEKDLYQNLFIDTYNRKNTNEQITGTIFQERMVIIMNKDYEKAEQQSQRMLGIGILVIVLIFVIIWYRYLKKKTERMIEESSYESNYTEKRP